MSNDIHPTALIGPMVELGQGNVIGAYAVLQGALQVGDDNWIGPHAVLGSPGELRGGPHTPPGPAPAGGAAWRTAQPDEPAQTTVIGSGNVIREFVTVQSGPTGTRLGDRCYLMDKVHVGHDSDLEDDVTVCCSVMVAGHVWIGRGATVGLGTVIHQHSRIGAGAMVGMGSAVTRPVPPWSTVVGSPARLRGANLHRLRSAAVPDDEALALDAAYREGRAVSAPPPALADDFDRFAERTGASLS